jgi:hypothetical protein
MQELAQARLEIARLRGLIALDRTGLAIALQQMLTLMRGWWWLAEDGNWSSYEYPNHTVAVLRAEIGTCLAKLSSVAKLALEASGSLVTEAYGNGEPIHSALYQIDRLTAAVSAAHVVAYTPESARSLRVALYDAMGFLAIIRLGTAQRPQEQLPLPFMGGPQK